MNINWLGWIIFIVLVLLLCIWIYCRFRRHKKAKCKVKEHSEKEKVTEINAALEPFGFAYSLSKDIFYSLEDAWQKNFGYGKIYDEVAPVMNMFIDCEPIYFEYDNRRWMIELWKGQYGITTGAEVGIYVEKKRGHQKNPEDVFYECVSKEEQLPMRMALYKNGKLLFQRNESHWWLTGFVLGEFSYPRELLLKVSITFQDHEMLEAFLKGCYQAGYQPEDLHVWYHQISLCLYQPKMPQPSYYGRIFCKYIQWQNHLNCKLYLWITRDFSKTADKLYYLMQAYPRIFGIIIKTGRIAWEKKKK